MSGTEWVKQFIGFISALLLLVISFTMWKKKKTETGVKNENNYQDDYKSEALPDLSTCRSNSPFSDERKLTLPNANVL